MSYKDILGKKYGLLTPIKYIGRRRGYWLCECECGNLKEVRREKLENQTTKSCGCLMKKRNHNLTGSKIYGRYNSMVSRCNNPNNKKYPLYGGRGIKVCERWLETYGGFQNFLEDMGYPPDGFLLDRMDCDGDYTPENCRWVDISTSNKNRRSWVRNKS